MKEEIFIKLIRIFLWLCICFLFLYFLAKSVFILKILQNINLPIEIERNLKEIFDQFGKIVEEIKKLEKFAGEKVNKLPEGGLKTKIKIEEKNQVSFFVIIKENEIYFSPEGMNNWKKFKTSESFLQGAESLKKILEKRKIFKKFDIKNGKIEFEIEKERLKKAIDEWGKEYLKQEWEENLGEGFEYHFGEIFFNQNKKIQRLVLKSEKTKISIDIESFDSQPKERTLEKFFVDLIEESLK